MSNIQRTLLALLGLIAVGGVGTLVLGTGGVGVHDGTGGLQLEHSVVRDPRPTPEGVATSLVSSEGRHAVLEGSGTIVDVRTMNDRGRRVPRAVIRLTNSAGEQRTGGDAARFENMAPGAWMLEVTATSMLTHTQEIEVVEGENHRYAIKLRNFLPITGRVLNRFGEPFGPTIVWFLHPGESHPMERPGARKLREAQVSSSGEFQIELNRAGEYRLSVGLIGKPLATMSKLRPLHPGASQAVEIVVPGGTKLEIQLEGASPALAAGKTDFRVAILGQPKRGANDGYRRPFKASSGARRGAPRRDKQAAQSGGETAGVDGGGRRGERGATKETPRGGKPRSVDPDPALGVSAPGAGRGAVAWAERLKRVVPKTGNLVFDGLPAGQELKLAFLRRNERHESTTTFVLQEDRRMVVYFRVPERLPKEQAGEVQELHLTLDNLPLPADAPHPGFYWK